MFSFFVLVVLLDAGLFFLGWGGGGGRGEEFYSK